jgi:hypothetical protein
MRHIKYYIIISCLLLNVTAVAQTLSLDAILTNVRTNNPQLKCTMPTYRVWMQHKGARSWMAPQVSTGLFMTPQHKSRYGVLHDRCDTNDSECFKAKS